MASGNIKNLLLSIRLLIDKVGYQLCRHGHHWRHRPRKFHPDWMLRTHDSFIRDYRAALSNGCRQILESFFHQRSKEKLNRTAKICV